MHTTRVWGRDKRTKIEATILCIYTQRQPANRSAHNLLHCTKLDVTLVTI